ncbi:MAG: hypothetical protein IJ419_06095 [Agathobacter sp.]|nr:hypothetical protein [Agathobacter sp.]
MKKFILLCIIAWLFPIAYFWIFKGDAIFYSLVFLHGWYNLFAVVVSFIIGARNYFGAFKWITPLVIGVMNAMTYLVTFGLNNDIQTGAFDSIGIDIRDVINHAILSLVGLVAGVLIGFIATRAKEQETKWFLFKIPSWMWGVFLAWIFPIVKYWILDFDTGLFFLFLYIWYMVLAFSTSVIIGSRDSAKVHKWLQIGILFLMNVGVYPLTVGLVELQKGGSVQDGIDNKYIVAQAVMIAVGFLIGVLVCYVRSKKTIKA